MKMFDTRIGFLSVVMVLVTSFGLQAMEDPSTELGRAISQGNINEVQRIIGQYPDLLNMLDRSAAGLTPLHRAASANNLDLVNALLQVGANPNVTSRNYNRTALHEAASLARVSPAIIQKLLDRGADVNAQDQGGFTPLLLVLQGDLTDAAKRERALAVAKLLLQAGADLTIENSDRVSALDRFIANPQLDIFLQQYLQTMPNQNQVQVIRNLIIQKRGQ